MGTRTKAARNNPARKPAAVQKKSSRYVEIWASVCHHVGAKACNLRMLEGHVKDAVRKGWRTLLLGDLVNNGISAGSKHVGLEFQDSMDPMSQCEKAIDVFMPVAKEGLLEMVVGGNHAYRTMRAVGIHPEKLIAMMLTIAASGDKPEGIMPSILQRVHELGHLAGERGRGGSFFHHFRDAKIRLMDEIAKVNPGTEERWAVPFYPGLGWKSIQGVPVASHHGTHARSRENWNRLERAVRGFRLMFTGHNHRLGWEPGLEDIRGHFNRQDYFSCGTYQGYEEYASIACYPRTPIGSILVRYNKDTDKVHCEHLE